MSVAHRKQSGSPAWVDAMGTLIGVSVSDLYLAGSPCIIPTVLYQYSSLLHAQLSSRSPL